MFKTLLLILICGGVGFAAYTLLLSPGLQNFFGGAIAPAHAFVAQLPDAAKLAVTAGVPALIATFMAWTKSRAMTQLQQTQQQASQAIQDKALENVQLSTQLGELQAQNTELQTQNAAYQQGNAAVATLQNTVTTLQKENTTLTREMNTMERTYQAIIEDLKQKEKIVVK